MLRLARLGRRVGRTKGSVGSGSGAGLFDEFLDFLGFFAVGSAVDGGDDFFGLGVGEDDSGSGAVGTDGGGEFVEVLVAFFDFDDDDFGARDGAFEGLVGGVGFGDAGGAVWEGVFGVEDEGDEFAGFGGGGDGGVEFAFAEAGVEERGGEKEGGGEEDELLHG